MRNLRYYSFKDNASDGYNANSRRSTEYPLMVNCAGLISLCAPFSTYNAIGRQDFYLMYIIEGNLKLSSDMGGGSVGAGTAVFFPPEYKYAYSFSGNGTLSYYFVHFTGSDVERIFALLGIGKLPTVLEAQNMDDIGAAFGRLFSSFEYEKNFFEVSSSAELGVILSLVARAYKMGRNKSPLSSSVGYINAFYTQNIKIPELAKMEGLSTSRYNALFREIYGVSTQRYIVNLRLKAAASLLKSCDLDIKEVGAAVGYSDNHFFSKIFKKYYSLSPKQYRDKGAE